MSSRAWIASLAALVALRVAIPLVALAASGHDLPGLPPYRYVPLNGDATGFYAEARELISAAFGPAGAVAALLLGAGAWSAWRLRPPGRLSSPLHSPSRSLRAARARDRADRSGGRRLAAALGDSAAALARVGVLDADLAFAVGFPILVAANAVTVVAIAMSASARAAGAGSASPPRRCSRSGRCWRGLSPGRAPGRTASGTSTSGSTSTPSRSRPHS